MKRKFQVFVSFTYDDLRNERQAAVEAILKAGHIPAGMELFTAGSESQLSVIRSWIEESDIFMLILGARYGSIEPKSGLSYVETEFKYALELEKPFFSIVLSEAGREAKVREFGTTILEQKNEVAYRNFRECVTSQMCAFFATPQDVKLAVFETLPQIINSKILGGWVSAAEAQPSEDVSLQLARLVEENQKLRVENGKMEDKLRKIVSVQAEYDELVDTLSNEKVIIPANLTESKTSLTRSLLDLLLSNADDLARGVSSAASDTEMERFLMYEVASKLAVFGLVEHAKVPAGVYWQRLKLSKEGIQFVTKAKVAISKSKKKKQQPARASEPSDLPSNPDVSAGRQAKKSRSKKG